MKKYKSLTVPIIQTVSDHGHYYFIMPDHASGRKHRFTTYKIPYNLAEKITIIGRELPLNFAVNHAKEKIKQEKILVKNSGIKYKGLINPILEKVGYDGHYYIIIPSFVPLKKNKYSVIRIPSSDSRKINFVIKNTTLKQAVKFTASKIKEKSLVK